MRERIKGLLKRVLPPTTSMVDRRIDLLIEENRQLGNQINELSGELALLRNELAALRADAIRPVMRESSSKPLDGSPSLVVSVASYGPRIATISPMIASLRQQSVHPDRAFLWLPIRDFPNGVDDLPDDVVCALHDSSVEPRFVETDLGPHNKYFWVMRAFPDSVVITLDDDVRYPNNLIDRLVSASHTWPDSVVAMRARLICSEGEQLLPYESWPLDLGSLMGVPSYQVIGTGVGGVLYPPHCLSDHLFDESAIRATCLRADDLWLKVMSVMAGTKTVCPLSECPLDYLPGTQETALCDENLYQGGNDVQLASILKHVSQFANVEDILQKMLGKG